MRIVVDFYPLRLQNVAPMETAPPTTLEPQTMDCFLFEFSDADERTFEERFQEFRQSLQDDPENRLIHAMRRDLYDRPDLQEILTPALELGWSRMVTALTCEDWKEAYDDLPRLCREAQENHKRIKIESAADIRHFRWQQENPYAARVKRMMVSPIAYLREVLGGSER